MKHILTALAFLSIVSLCFASAEPAEGASQVISLKPGWNLVTLNRKLDNLYESSRTFFLELKPIRYDAASKSYVMCTADETPIPGASYWIYSAEAKKSEPLTLRSGNTTAASAEAGTYNFVGMAAGSTWADGAERILTWNGDAFVNTDAATVKAAAVEEGKGQVGSGIGYWVKMP